jgi:hypothetical protein
MLARDSSLADLVGVLQSLLSRPASVSRRRRLVLLGASLLIPVIPAIMGMTEFPLRTRFLQARPELAALQQCLEQRDLLQWQTTTGAVRQNAVADALDICIAAYWTQIKTNRGAWYAFQRRTVIYAEVRQQVERIQHSRPIPSPTALAQAEALVKQFFSEPSEAAALASFRKVGPLTVMSRTGYLSGLVFVVLPCLIASVFFRGGLLMRALGIALVNKQGTLLTGCRVAGRNLVAWLPFLLLPLPAYALEPFTGAMGGFLLTEIACLALAVASVSLPQRGLQDRLTGTWPVPR